MGKGSFDQTSYQAAAAQLEDTGQTFARSQTASQTGNYSDIAESLDPRMLKNGQRECCFASGFDNATPVVVSIDGTASMDQVPYLLQAGLPEIISLLTGQGVSDHPNIMFMCHDDEHAVGPDAAFQMSQFETEADKLLTSLNELIIPHNGGGNKGEAYHLSIYAAAYHTRLECFERDPSEKGFFFLIGDEEPYYHAADPATHGTTPEIAKEVFGDTIEATVTMLESLKKLAERYHVYVIRPGHTSHGTDQGIKRIWQDLFRKAGIDAEHVIEIKETEAIVPTISILVGGVLGADHGEMVDVLRAKGTQGIDSAASATLAIVPVGAAGGKSTGKASTALATTASGATATGRARRS